MSRYDYSKKELQINKVIKMHEKEEYILFNKNDEMKRDLDNSISSSERLLQQLGYGSELKKLKEKKQEVYDKERLKIRDWDLIVSEAEKEFSEDVFLEDILSADEFKAAIEDCENIRNDFARRVKLGKTDITFLFLATALLSLKSLLIPQLGERIDGNKRLKHDDPKIKKEIKLKNQQFKDKHLRNGGNGSWEISPSDKGYKSWLEIIFSSVPYDATKGAKAIGINMEGGYHRYKTLGHDPILGWIFGTANIITDTITLTNFSTHRIKKMTFVDERITLGQMFYEVKDSLEEDFHRLPAAVFAQGVHLKSDKYTKLGLPVPILATFSEELAGDLYKSQYDSLCLNTDLKTISFSVFLSIFINMMIGIIHGMFYSPKKEKNRCLYEVKTRKIILYSNVIASSSNIIQSVITKNLKNLDIGGLLVTLSRLFMDIRFISRIQKEFIEEALLEKLNTEMMELEKFIDSNYIV